MARRQALDRAADRSTGIDHVSTGPQIKIKDTCANKKSYDGWIKATWRHLMRWSRGLVAHQEINQHVHFSRRYNGRDASTRTASQPLDRDPTAINQNASYKRFIWLNRGRPSRSDGHDLIETVHRGPFHRNRRSKWSDGYAQICYK